MKHRDGEGMPETIWVDHTAEAYTDDKRIVCGGMVEYTRTSSVAAKMEAAEKMAEALQKIAKRPDLPNPDRDADWKNCQKWSSHEAKEALTHWHTVNGVIVRGEK